MLNQRVANLPKSQTLAINERSNDLIKQGKQVYKFGLGQSPFPVPLPMQEALRDNAHQKDYLAVQGLKELRETIAKFASNAQGIEYSGANVMIGCVCQLL